MRQLQIHYFLLSIIFLATTAHAQKGDWRAVKEIPPGTPISVKYRGFFIHNRCIFENATDDVLVCERVLFGTSRLFLRPEAIYRRKLISEVRLEHSEASNIAVGAAIGGGVGAAMGAAGTGDTSARARFSAGLLLGMGEHS